MAALRRLWRGELPLADAFWGWAVAGGLLVNIASSAGFLLLASANRPVAALLVGYGLSLPYNLLVSVGVWRAAGRHPGDPRWAALARIATLAGMLLLSLT